MERKKITIRLHESIASYIEIQAKERGMSEPEVIRNILADYKQRHEIKEVQKSDFTENQRKTKR